MWKRIAYGEILLRNVAKTPEERIERNERVAELLKLPYLKRKNNDRCNMDM